MFFFLILRDILNTATLSPPSMYRSNVGLFFPRNNITTSEASRPSVFSEASIVCNVRFIRDTKILYKFNMCNL